MGALRDGTVRPGLLAALFLATAATTSGCASFTVGHLAEIATDPRVTPAAYTAPTRHVTGHSCVLLLSVTPTRYPSLAEAVDRALAGTGSDVLRNTTIRFRLFYTPLFVGQACYEVEGDA